MPQFKQHIPFVSSDTHMIEFTIRALIIGLIMAVILGAANAYLGLKAGMTVAATYPAAVIGMALLRIMKGTILEENIARTVGSIGESIAGGAIFTIPAFYISGVWTTFGTWGHYLIASSILFCGGLLGIMFVTLLRRVMVDDVELRFPESIAASEIHKAGQSGSTGAKFLLSAMGISALIQTLGQFSFFATHWQKFITFAKTTIGLKSLGNIPVQGGLVINSPEISPCFIGVGYIIGPKLAAQVFSGGVLAWGLLIPLILYFLAPGFVSQWQIAHPGMQPGIEDWINMSTMIWKFIVRPLAIGGMLVGAIYTLFKMKKNLMIGIGKSIGNVKKAIQGTHVVDRINHDLSFKWVSFGISFASIITFILYYHFAQNIFIALIATIIMIIAGFFFAAISGFLCGVIGSSNNPVSGLALTALVFSALLMVALGAKGMQGIATVIGVAGVVCVSSAVAGEMFQDLKVGHILGGTPWKMQVGDIIGIAVTSAIMFLPLVILNQGDINAGQMALHHYEGGFGSINLSAPQASLIALLSQGIVSGQMAWPLIIVGMFLGVVFILMQVKSPMLTSIGIYLPFPTTCAMFLGGIMKYVADKMCEKKKLNDAQKIRVENIGILLASGLVAGEALIGLVFAALAFFNISLFVIFKNPSIFVSGFILLFIGWFLVKIPLKNAGNSDQLDSQQAS